MTVGTTVTETAVDAGKSKTEADQIEGNSTTISCAHDYYCRRKCTSVKPSQAVLGPVIRIINAQQVILLNFQVFKYHLLHSYFPRILSIPVIRTIHFFQLNWLMMMTVAMVVAPWHVPSLWKHRLILTTVAWRVKALAAMSWWCPFTEANDWVYVTISDNDSKRDTRLV